MKNLLLSFLPKALAVAVLGVVGTTGAATAQGYNYGYQYHYNVDPYSGTWNYQYRWHVTPVFVPPCRTSYYYYTGYRYF